jgi:ABC-type bacteriocin/lantibiotic exporter with double-glycine peptidase domain
MQIAAVLEGFGVSLMLPIIQGGDSPDSQLETLIDWAFDVANIPSSLGNILIVLILFFLIRAALLMGQTWFAASVLTNNLVGMRTDFIGALARSKYGYLRTLDTGVLGNVLSRELQTVNFALAQMMKLMVAITTSAVYIGIAALMAPIVTLFLVLLAIPVMGIMLVINKATASASLKHTAGSNRQLSLTLEMLNSMKYLSSTARTAPVMNRVVQEFERVGAAFRKLYFLQGATGYGLEPILVIFLAGVIFFLVDVRGGEILDILFLLFIFRTAAVNLIATQPAYRNFVSATGSLKIYEELTSGLVKNRLPDTSNRTSPDFAGDLELKNVSYRYTASSHNVLDDVSITIPSRSTIALVGPSGSGKSTLANLMISLIEPSSGQLSLSGTNYEDIDLETMRKQVGYVTQESVVFNASIEDNITLWESSSDQEKLSKIVEATQLSELVTASTKKNSPDYAISHDGLSGGERQRVSIARELYWDSELLIMDEATSSMDSILENQMDEILDDQRGKSTIVVIAHRLSTVRNADKIFVLDEGKIKEQGTFDELSVLDGLFAKMVKMQSL